MIVEGVLLAKSKSPWHLERVVNNEVLISVLVFLGLAVGTIWLLKFGMVWLLISLALFIGSVLSLFSGAIGPGLGFLVLCPVAFGIGFFIIELKDKRKQEAISLEFERRMRTAQTPAYNPPITIDEADEEEEAETGKV